MAGGQFTTIGGQTRNHIARLDAATGLADSFNPNAGGNVFAIAVQRDGKILAGGNFTTIGGQQRARLARLDAATGLADSFDASADSFIESIAVQADGKVLAGGHFSTIRGISRNRIARLNTDGTLDTGFDPNADDDVLCIAVQPDGDILFGGIFTSLGGVGGTTRNRLARLHGNTGALDNFFNPDVNNTVLCIAVQSDGKILTGGDFTVIGGQFPSPPTAVTRNRIARLGSDGKVEQTFNFGVAGDFVNAIAVQPDGKILIGGSFTNNIARLNSDGSVDTGFFTTTNGLVTAIAVQGDGKILLGGQFSTVSGSAHSWLARVQGSNGQVDGTFNPNVNSQVLAIAVREDGRILIGGNFTSVGGQTRNGLAELAGINATTVDGFNPNANSIVYSLALQPDGKLLVAGFFTSIGGVTRNRLARLDASGAPDSFDPNANDSVLAVAVQMDGKILVGGFFTNIGGQPRNGLARLDPVTGLADTFNANSNSHVNALVLQADGKILVGGNFHGTNCIGGATRNYIARVDGASGLADSFNPNANDTVYSIALQQDGKVLAGGVFTSIGGQSRNRFARLSNDTAAFSTLKVTQSTITLTQGGSAPQFTHVSFGSDYEYDGIYGLVGTGTPQGSSFTLTGQNFPTGQDFLIRSRGYFRTGYLNGSETTEHNIRNVFLTLPPTPSQVVSRKLHGGMPFDINLPLTGNPGIECRSGGATNDYQIVLSFPNAVTFTVASVTIGTGSVSSSNGSGTNIVTINLTGVSNAQRVTVTLSGVSDGTNTGDINVPMGMLIGEYPGMAR